MMSLGDRILDSFVEPINLAKAGATMDHMRFVLGYTYEQCRTAVEQVLPGTDYEDIARQVEEDEAHS